MFKTAVGNGLLTSEGEVWRKQRRLMQPAFHHQRLEKLDGLITGAAGAMLERWGAAAEAGQAIDIAREMASLTLTITTKALFGIDLGEDVNSVGAAVNMGADLLERPKNPRFRKALQSVKDVVERIISERRLAHEDTGDLLSMLLQVRDEETGLGMDDQQLRDQVITLLLAGYETTASALTWTWYLLSQHPESAERMQAESRRVLAGRSPANADLPNLPYARMVFEESMRLFPPAWILGRKALSDDQIGGYQVPAGTIVAISPYTLHRHPGFWERPDDFEPERFSPERSAGRNRYVYIPFGAGPRKCIGNTFGMLEAQLILPTVAGRFNLRLAPGIEINPQPVFILRPNRDMLMIPEALS
jgi:cytochrome P450